MAHKKSICKSMSEFDEYIRQGELGPRQKAQAWQTAIGLQDVDGLKPSPYLLDTAKRHIEGDITIDEVKGLIDTYYKSRKGRLSSGNLVLGEQNELKNRYLHIGFQSAKQNVSKCQIDTLNVTLEERAVLNCILADARITQSAIAIKIGKSSRTVKRIIASLTEKQIISRKNGKRNGWWEVVPASSDI